MKSSPVSRFWPWCDAAAKVYARDGLARWLRREGVEYEAFDDLDDVLRSLEAR